MRYLFLITLFLSAFSAFSQDKDSLQTTKSDTVFLDGDYSQFAGGKNAWKEYLKKKIDWSLAYECIKIPKGQYSASATVMISFVIDTLGNVTDVKLYKTIPTVIDKALIKESIRVIKKSPQWSPATQNGRKVFYRHVESITFSVVE